MQDDPKTDTGEGIDPHLLRDYLNSLEHTEKPSADSEVAISDRITEAENQRAEAREEWEKQRRAELMEKLYGSYSTNSKGDFLTKKGELAFSASDKRISTDKSDEQTVHSMLDLAQAKGWQTVQVKGQGEFRRATWLEASLRGLDVQGYKPSEQDVAELEERRKLRSRNTVEQAHSDKEKQALKETPVKPEKEKELPTASRADILSGTLVDHGIANQDFKSSGESSYFIKINTASGVKIAWGKDLQHAMTETEAKPGDKVTLDNVSYRNIQIKDYSDKERKSVNEQVLMGAASGLISKHVKDPVKRDAYMQGIRNEISTRKEQGTLPQVRVFDKNSPSRAPEIAAPTIERHSDRERSR